MPEIFRHGDNFNVFFSFVHHVTCMTHRLLVKSRPHPRRLLTPSHDMTSTGDARAPFLLRGVGLDDIPPHPEVDKPLDNIHVLRKLHTQARQVDETKIRLLFKCRLMSSFCYF